MSCKVFVDDCGFKDYIFPFNKMCVDTPPPFAGSEEYWRSNYFLLCAVKIDSSIISTLDTEIRKLKQKYFRTDKVEIKSYWLRMPKERLKRYIQPYGITDAKLNEFGEAIFDIFPKYQKGLKIFVVAVDKRYFKDRASIENDPLCRATQVLLERVSMTGGCDEIIFDQMESKTSITVGKHKTMIDIYSKNAGVKKAYLKNYKNIKKAWFAKSEDNAFLQLADICAYCSYRQLIENGRIMTGQEKNPMNPAELRTYSYFSKIENNVHHSPDGNKKVSGFGFCVIPNPKGKELTWVIR